ncbi:DedA family protein [Bacillus solitudinis]|uniref:DedA family protein n=1 Tax=Bacillus solitudinis TaxID=2014074 RepID=UPI000C248243|nr:DedA family protein [Bacillus solitudinis]
MDTATIIQFIQSHGYVALLLVFTIGLFLFPVPNELLIMSGGWLATTYLLDPIPSFLIIYLSIFFHGTILYTIGSLVSKKAHISFKPNSIWQKNADKGKELLEQYGLKATSFSYFFPFIRHAIPFSVGISDISYRRFALIGFSSAFVWMSIYFFLGLHFGRSITNWTTFIDQVIFVACATVVIVIIFQIVKKKKKNQKEPYMHS